MEDSSLEVLGIEAAPGECVVAIVPSRRVSSEEFLALLGHNEVVSRIIGSGSGKVTADGRRVLVRGIIVVAILKIELSKTQNLARLCGITAVVP